MAPTDDTTIRLPDGRSLDLETADLMLWRKRGAAKRDRLWKDYDAWDDVCIAVEAAIRSRETTARPVDPRPEGD
jgi:hypothetical protein